MRILLKCTFSILCLLVPLISFGQFVTKEKVQDAIKRQDLAYLKNYIDYFHELNGNSITADFLFHDYSLSAVNDLKVLYDNGLIELNTELYYGTTFFHLVCRKKDVDYVDSIMGVESLRNVDLFPKSTAKDYPLAVIIEENLKSIFYKYVKFYEREVSKNLNQLLFSCSSDDLEILKSLIQMGASPSLDVLNHHVARGNLSTVKYLVEYSGLQVDFTQTDFLTSAVISRKDSMLLYMIDKQPQFANSRWMDGEPLFILLVSQLVGDSHRDRETLLKRMQNAGAKVNIVDKNGKNALYYVKSDLDLLAILLDLGVRLDSSTYKSSSFRDDIIKNSTLIIDYETGSHDLVLRQDLLIGVSKLYMVGDFEAMQELMEEHTIAPHEVVSFLLNYNLDKQN